MPSRPSDELIAELRALQPRDMEARLRDIYTWRRYNAAELFEPYPKQKEFFALRKRERMLIAGNQLGKSYAGAFEVYCHLTGIYPDWWEGRRWDRPTKGWVAGEGALLTRDGPQALLFGTPGDGEAEGSGMIPRTAVIGHNASHGVTDAYDTARVRHISGGVSTVSFKSYDQGRTKFQAASLDWIWLDEEAPEDVYMECLARTTATDGMVFLTFTPLQGLTQVVVRFLHHPDINRGFVRYGIDHAEHLTQEQRDELLNRYPKFQRQARLNGEPMLEGGGVYLDINPSNYTCDGTTFVPLHWTKLWGMDFGIAHPFAAVLTAWDRDTDVLYVLDTIKLSDALPLQHADAIKRRGPEIPVAWPHDGNAREKSSGDTLISAYKRQGLRVLSTHAQFPGGGYSTEAAVLEVRERMASGRLKIMHHLSDLFSEINLYHRDKNGALVKQFDDLLSALYKAVMAKRFGKPVPLGAAAPHMGGVRTQQRQLRARNMNQCLEGF